MSMHILQDLFNTEWFGSSSCYSTESCHSVWNQTNLVLSLTYLHSSEWNHIGLGWGTEPPKSVLSGTLGIIWVQAGHGLLWNGALGGTLRVQSSSTCTPESASRPLSTDNLSSYLWTVAITSVIYIVIHSAIPIWSLGPQPYFLFQDTGSCLQRFPAGGHYDSCFFAKLHFSLPNSPRPFSYFKNSISSVA